MSSVSQQRAGLQTLSNTLDWSRLKRAGITQRQSEGEYLIQMLKDSIDTLGKIPDAPVPAKKEGNW